MHVGFGSVLVIVAIPARLLLNRFWASTREVFNVVEADAIGCHIITAPAEVLKKLPALGSKSAAELSRGAVQSFRDDALATGLTLADPACRAAE